MMVTHRGLRVTALLVMIVLAAVLTVRWLLQQPASESTGGSPVALLGGEPDGFARVEAPRQFEFPRDHGAHPDYRTEWWYFTGNLDTDEGRPFGFQVTFFRNALVPEPPSRESAWGSNQVYLGHFALSDIDAGHFHAFERYSREALDMAGVAPQPFRVWLHHWRVASTGEDFFPMELAMQEDDVSLRLTLDAEKPRVLQGERGYSQKSDDPGNASYYYSYTRLNAEGEISIGDQRWPVSGHAWLDREWSTSVLDDGQVGWDWFSLQLDDNSELMFFLLRREDGELDPHSAGVKVEADGEYRALDAESIAVEVLDHWRSPDTGARYPAGWRLRGEGLDLEVQPLMSSQELDLSFRYWEGAVEVSGEHRGEPVGGRGYVEMTGY